MSSQDSPKRRDAFLVPILSVKRFLKEAHHKTKSASFQVAEEVVFLILIVNLTRNGIDGYGSKGPRVCVKGTEPSQCSRPQPR